MISKSCHGYRLWNHIAVLGELRVLQLLHGIETQLHFPLTFSLHAMEESALITARCRSTVTCFATSTTYCVYLLAA